MMVWQIYGTNGVANLQSCAPEEQLARKLNAAALDIVPDYCTKPNQI